MQYLKRPVHFRGKPGTTIPEFYFTGLLSTQILLHRYCRTLSHLHWIRNWGVVSHTKGEAYPPSVWSMDVTAVSALATLQGAMACATMGPTTTSVAFIDTVGLPPLTFELTFKGAQDHQRHRQHSQMPRTGTKQLQVTQTVPPSSEAD